MNDLIPRNAAIEAFDDERVDRNYGDVSPESVIEVIESIPAVDAAPVAHGRWYDKGSLSCRCSCCGCKSNKEYNYCPNCGAKMDAKNPEPQYPTWGEWLESIGVIKYNNRADSINYLIRPTHKTNTQIPADIAQKLEIEPKEK